jgi:hypothetical protein
MTVDEFVKNKVLPEYQPIVSMLRGLMFEMAPDIKEVINYGIPVYKKKRAIAVISPTKKGITFAFSRGSQFEDKYGLLEGEGKISKNLRIKSIENVNKDALKYYIKQALDMDSR